MEWILVRTTSDLMGKFLLCWVTVVLWVRVALNLEATLVRKQLCGCEVGVNNRDCSMRTQKKLRLKRGRAKQAASSCLTCRIRLIHSLLQRPSRDVTQRPTHFHAFACCGVGNGAVLTCNKQVCALMSVGSYRPVLGEHLYQTSQFSLSSFTFITELRENYPYSNPSSYHI